MAYKTVKPGDLIERFCYALNDKWGYIWGKAGSLWTEADQKAIEKTTDADREMARKYGSKWIGHYVTDCSGLFSWAFKQLGSYMYHGSNTMWNKYCVEKGELKAGKRVDEKELKAGTAVFTHNKNSDVRGHVGLYIGNGEVVEAADTVHGVIKSKITNKKWVEWGELKYVDYGNSKPVTPTYPTIREGTKGDIVVQLQDLLYKCGSNLAVDGIFGKGTRSAVRAFQKKYGLEVDGIVGPKTWAKLLEVAANIAPAKEKPAVKSYTVTIPNLSASEADKLVSMYKGATVSDG